MELIIKSTGLKTDRLIQWTQQWTQDKTVSSGTGIVTCLGWLTDNKELNSTTV